MCASMRKNSEMKPTPSTPSSHSATVTASETSDNDFLVTSPFFESDGKSNAVRKPTGTLFQSDEKELEAYIRKIRRNAAIQRRDFVKLALYLRSEGVILPPQPWLREVAYCLSAAPAGPLRNMRKFERSAPRWKGCDWDFYVETMVECGFSEEEIDDGHILDQVNNLRAETNWIGLRNIDKVGFALGVTSDIRRDARVRLIGAIGENPVIRAKAREARKVKSKAAKRRAAGSRTRAEISANSAERIQPWVAEGISRRTYYYRKKANGHVQACTDLASNCTAVAPTTLQCKVVGETLVQKTAQQSGSPATAPIINPSRFRKTKTIAATKPSITTHTCRTLAITQRKTHEMGHAAPPHSRLTLVNPIQWLGRLNDNGSLSLGIRSSGPSQKSLDLVDSLIPVAA
jgi:hypothetical protein